MNLFFRRWGAAIFFAVIALLALTACSGGGKATIPSFEPIAFKAERIPVRAAGVEIEDKSGTPGDPPRIEASLPAPAVPAQALARWPGERLKLTGGGNKAVFTIRKASVTRENLETTGGIAGMFQQEATARIAVAIDAALRLEDAQGERRGRASVQVTRTTTILEGTGKAQRARTIYGLTEGAVQGFDRRMAEALRTNLGEFVGAPA